MQAVLSDLGHGKLKRLGASIVIGVCILAVSAAVVPALPQSGGIRSFDAVYLEAVIFIDDSAQVLRQDAATESDQQTLLFGMETVPVAGELAVKWRAVEADIEREQQVLARCRAQEACPAVAQELLDIVAEGAGRSGRARVGLINRAVDLAITPTSDEAQWGVADHWSPPFETLQSHRGDCEDYAIVKYVALLQAGLSHEDVRIVILRNVLPKEDHAAVAARVDGRWLILDNGRLALVRDTDVVRSIPKFVLDQDGARRFVPSSRARQGIPRSAPSSTISQASSARPARSSKARRGTPVHSALLTAPSSHCAPCTWGTRKTRLLPAHSKVATRVSDGMLRNSS
jgi:predicted transglutaminase-like cysteine proteinase